MYYILTEHQEYVRGSNFLAVELVQDLMREGIPHDDIVIHEEGTYPDFGETYETLDFLGKYKALLN